MGSLSLTKAYQQGVSQPPIAPPRGLAPYQPPRSGFTPKSPLESLGTSGATQAGADIFAGFGRLPGQVYATPPAVLDVATGGALGRAVGAIPFAGAVAGGLDTAIRKEGALVPALINRQDAAIWSIVGNLPDDTEITNDVLARGGMLTGSPFGGPQQTGGIPLLGNLLQAVGLGLGPLSHNKTVKELREELTKRGFFYDDKGTQLDPRQLATDIASGKRSIWDFGNQAINDDPLVSIASSFVLDPLNLLFLVPGANVARGAMVAAKLNEAMRGLNALQKLQKGMHLIKVADAITGVPKTVNTLSKLAGVLKTYQKVAIGTAAANTALNVGARVINTYDLPGESPFTHAIQDFTDLVTGRRDEMSENTALTLFAAFTFPYGAVVRGTVGKARSLADRKFGSGIVDAFSIAADKSAPIVVNGKPLRGTKKVVHMAGGPESLAAMINWAKMLIAARSEHVPPAARSVIETMRRSGSLPELVESVRNSRIALGRAIEVMDRNREFTSEGLLAEMRSLFEKQGGFEHPDGAWSGEKTVGINPADFPAMLKRWADFYHTSGEMLGNLMDVSGELTIGLRAKLLKEQVDTIHQGLHDARQYMVVDGVKQEIVPLAVVRQMLNDNPHLQFDDKTGYWAKFGEGADPKHPPTWASLRAKLAAAKRAAVSMTDYYAAIRNLERQAPKDIQAEFTAYRGQRDLRAQIDELRQTMEQERASNAPPTPAEMRAAALAEELRNKAAFFEERHKATGVQGMADQARTARAQAEDAARMAGKAHTGEVPKPAGLSSWQSQEATVGATGNTPFYHAATPQEFAALQRDGLAGSSQFGASPKGVADSFAPGENDVLVRVPRGAVRTHIGDAVPPSAMEYRGEDGAWHPVAEGVASRQWQPSAEAARMQDIQPLLDKLQRLADDPGATPGEVQAALAAMDRVTASSNSGVWPRLKELTDQLRDEQVRHDEAVAAGAPGLHPDFMRQVYDTAAANADVPLPFFDAAIKHADPVEKVLLGILDREMAHATPSYQLTGLPVKLIEAVPDSALAPLRYRTSLGEALFVQGPLSGVGRALHTMTRPITNVELRAGVRTDLQRQLLPMGWKVGEIDRLIQTLEETANEPRTAVGTVKVALHREAIALWPSQVDKAFRDTVATFKGPTRAKAERMLAEAGGGYQILGAAHSRFNRGLQAKVLPGREAEIRMQDARGRAVLDADRAVRARAAIDKVTTKRAKANRAAKADAADAQAAISRAAADAAEAYWKAVRNPRAENVLSAYNGWMTNDHFKSLSRGQRQLAKFFYPMFRFTMDPRYLLMNYVEGGILATTRFGRARAYKSEAEASNAAQFFEGSSRTRFDMSTDPAQQPNIRPMNLLAQSSFDHASLQRVADRIAELEALGHKAQAAKLRAEQGLALTAEMEALIDEHGATNAILLRMRQGVADEVVDLRSRADAGLRDGTLTEAQAAELRTVADHYQKAGNLGLAEYLNEQMYRMEEVGPSVAITEQIQKLVTREDFAQMAPLLQELHDVNVRTWNDVRSLFYGNPARSNLERLMNSYWLYWPISYQIKATKWLAQIMLDGSFGNDNHALLAGRYAIWQQQHNEMLANNPDYRALMESNPVVAFAAQMLMPISPDGIGVSLSRMTRVLGTLGEAGFNQIFGPPQPGQIGGLGWTDGQLNAFTLDALLKHPGDVPSYLATFGPVYTLDLIARLGRDVESAATPAQSYRTPLRQSGASSTLDGVQLLPPIRQP